MTKQKEQKPWDITKSGPKSYRDLQKQNAAMYEGIDAPTDKEYLYRRNLANAYKSKSLYNAAEAAPTRVQSPLYGTHTPLGQSAYDQSEYSIDEFNDAGYIRGENQPWIMQAINGTTKAAVLAGTTVLNGVLGSIYGTATAIYHKDFDRFWDNDFSNAMKFINDASEEWLPNYYTKEEQENPWYTNIFTPNFIFDKVVKNIGFIAGAAFAGGIYVKALGIIFKGIGAMRALLDTGRSLKQALEIGGRAMKMSSAARHTKSIIGSVMNAIGEGTIEAINNSDDYASAEKQKYDALSAEDMGKAYDRFAMEGGEFDANGNPVLDNTPKSIKLQADLKKIAEAKQAAYKGIEESRKRVGTWDLAANLPILTLGNWYTFGKMYAGGWKGAKSVNGIRTRATKEAMDAAKKEGKDAVKRLHDVVKKAKKTGYQGLTTEEKALVEEGKSYLLGDKSYATLKALGEPLKEGLEEMNQSLAAKIPSNYYGSRIDAIYDAKMDRESTEQVVDWWKATVQGFKDIYGNIDNYEEGFIGALTGMMGSPTFGKKNNSTSETYIGRSKWIGMSGGVVPQWRNAVKDREHEAEIISHVNNILKNGNLERGVKHLIAQTFFDNKQRVAVIKDDKKDYKDSELASMFENIMYLREAGKLDLLKRAITNMDGYTEDDAKKILETTKKEISIDGKNIETLIKRRDDLTAKYEEELEAFYKEKEGTRQFEQSMDASNPDQVAKLQEAKNNQARKEEQLNSMLDDIEKISKEVKDANSHTESGYLKEDGELMSPEEVLEDLNKRKEKYNKIIDYVANTIKDIDNATEETLSNEQLSTLVWYKTMMKDWQDRANSMGISLDRLIGSIVNNPELQASLQALDDRLEGIDESKLTSLEQIVYGGQLRNRKLLKNYLASAKSIMDLFQKINEHSEDAGLALARALNDDTEITIGEGKNAKKVKNGDHIFDALISIIEANKTFTEDEKMAFNKNLTDLKRIGNNYNTYMKLLTEYTKNPGNIDKAHEASTNQATREAKRDKNKRTTDSIRFDGTLGELATDIKYKKDDLEDIGFDEWKDSLDEEQQRKVDAAEKFIDVIDSLHEMIDEKVEDEALNKVMHRVVEEAIEESSDVTDLMDKISAPDESERLSSAIDKAVEVNEMDDMGKQSEKERLEAGYREVFNEETLNKILAAADAKEKAHAKQQEEIEKQANRATEEEERKEEAFNRASRADDDGVDTSVLDKEEKDEEKGEEKGKGRTSRKRQTPASRRKNTPKKTDTTVENTPSTVEQDETEVKNQAKQASMKGRHKRRKESNNYSTSFSNRPQISEYLMFGNDLQTYLQYIKEHPESIPKAPEGTSQEEFSKAYIHYIETVHKYLKDNGAFDYVKKNLKLKDELIFTVDEELNKEAEVPIVVIKAKTENDDYVVVGTIKSKLDFDSMNYRTKKPYGETDTEQKKLYEEVLEKYKEYKANKEEGEFIGAESSVNKLMGGDIAFSAVNEHSVSDIFENTGSPIIFGVVDSSGTINTGNDDYNGRILQVDISSAKSGQVYILIPSNNGSLVPALCYGTNIEDLINNDDDWYINKMIETIQSLTNPLKLGDSMNDLAKLLGYSTQSFNVHYGTYEDSKVVRTDNIEEADRINIHYKDRRGKKVVRTIKLDENKQISRGNAKVFINSAIKHASENEGRTLTVNLDTRKVTNKEYLDNISEYYYTNVVQGETHTINDWFTYKSLDKEKKSKKPVTPSPKETTPTGAPKSTVTKVVDGVTYTIEDGNVYDEDGNRLSKEEADKVLGKTEERKPKEEKPKEEKPKEESKEEKKPRSRRKRKGRESVSLLNIPKEEEDKGESKEDTQEETPKEDTTQEEPKEEPKEKEEEKEDDNNEGTPTNTSELGEDRAKTTRAKQRNNKRRRPRASSEESTEAKAEPKETTKKTLREKTVDKAVQIFPDADKSRLENIVNKIFDSVENNKGAMGLIKDISNVVKFLKRLYDPVAGFTVRHYNNFLESIFTPSEIEEIDAAAKDEYGLSDNYSLRTVQKVEAIMNSLKEYMDGYNRVKSKCLLNAFKVIKNIVDTVGKNIILMNNFLNRTMINAGFIMDNRSPQDGAIENSLRIKYAFKNLSKELKDVLSARGISEQVYSALSPYQQMAYLRC
jgi:hypothetical protein